MLRLLPADVIERRELLFAWLADFPRWGDTIDKVSVSVSSDFGSDAVDEDAVLLEWDDADVDVGVE